jgi:hypothetical protein
MREPKPSPRTNGSALPPPALRRSYDKAKFSRWFADEADPRALLVPYPSDALSITQIGKRSR